MRLHHAIDPTSHTDTQKKPHKIEVTYCNRNKYNIYINILQWKNKAQKRSNSEVTVNE